jgi:hypothetical protein
MQPDRRELLLDELGRCHMRAAVDRFLAESSNCENAAESGQEQRRRKEAEQCGDYSNSQDGG